MIGSGCDRDDPAGAVLVIAGPTASGKSALALAVAERLDGVVINADSMQVYAELAILTARPGPAELARVPHRLYGVLPGAQACSAARWCAWAVQEIAAARAGGRRPIIVGGTGLYLRALITGLVEIPAIPEPVRAAARALHAELGGPAFHARLAQRDPATAARLRPGDPQRLIRAWEVIEATGRPLSAWHALPTAPAPGLRFDVVLLDPPRAPLYQACNRRFEAMVRAGAVAEVERLMQLGLDPGLPVLKAVGVPELAAFLRREITLEAAIAAAQQATRHYAKRQTTWFRHQLAALMPHGCHVVTEQYSERLLPEIFPIIGKMG
ncbi:MAG: tRNA (adenosine(37)-N6)-dimethylallyltransferase MiaA [Azospirillaceae bacterium]|nr:tRNA (adenosine(37)-N6)-dimethylallyltransferase MiaA [Azospirillaceae bacterium]